MFKRFRKLRLSDSDFTQATDILRVVNQLQQNIDDSITPLSEKTQNDSNIIQNVVLFPSANNVVNHSLGRQLTGYNIIRKNAQADIYDTQDKNTSQHLTLWLSTSALVMVDILVF